MYYKNSILIFGKDAVKEIPCDKKTYIKSPFTVGSKNDFMGILSCDKDRKKAVFKSDGQSIELKPYENVKYDEDTVLMYFINESARYSTNGNQFITIGNEESCTIYLNLDKNFKLRLEGNKLFILRNKSDIKKVDTVLTKEEDNIEESEVEIEKTDIVLVNETGNTEEAELECAAALASENCEADNSEIDDDSELGIYLNGQRTKENPIILNESDCIFIDKIKITYEEDSLIITGNSEDYKTSLNKLNLNEERFEGFPRYKRSPRIIKNVPEDEVVFKNPPKKSEKKKGQLAKTIVPPLMMCSLTLIINFIQPRGIYVLMSLAGTAMSTVFSVTSYISDKKEEKKKNELRVDVYTKYLLKLRKKLDKLKKEQIESLRYHNPSLEEIDKMTEFYSSRIYERTHTDDDFLSVSIGNADVEPSYKLKFSNDGIEMEKDELMDECNEIYREFSKVENVPFTVDLKKAHLGIVGEKKYIHEQLNLIFAQLTLFQSYHDLEIILIHNQKYQDDFKWLNWYPHFKINSINVTGIINSERVRDQVLGNVAKIMKDREVKLKEKKENLRFLPHFLFVIDEPVLVLNHAIMEYLQKYDANLCFSVIYTSYLQANLPENIKTIMTLDNYEEGTLVINEGRLLNKKIKLNHVNIELSNLSRRLSCLQHVKGMVNQIPDSITFFEMYKVKSPKDFNIEERWEKNQSYKTLAVPLGVRGKDDIVYLNLHEKAHGPHGLVAGTTGSGKSEIVQSYILSLALNYHPYEVGFLLIDYKGGGMASLFSNLPHLLGTITNLDGSESMRAMASIKSELSRRQAIFSKYGVNHINQYNKLFKNGEASEPIPHLFLISDEFAELKKEQPDFMSELVSAARIGRSLGIHLILATQKPSGVVDDQIWSNSKFKLALKVQNEADSNEVIKTPDAAKITQAGRAYLQVGNNEIYELFQSAWSGAAYSNEEEEETVDDRVYLINDIRQGQLLNNDLSKSSDDMKLKATELDVTVDYMKDLFDKFNLPGVRKPWLPSLKTKIVSPHIDENNVVDTAQFEILDLNAAVGIVDKPEVQAQDEYELNFAKDGNFVIFSSSGFGKTTTLTTLILSLAVKNSPENLQFFILDFGNSGLIAMKDMPHTRDYLKFDDNVKFEKFTKIINEESKKRKRLFGEASAANFTMYNELSEKKLPALFIIIDNYDAIKEFGPEAEDFIMKATRDGAGIGIFTVITASRQNAVKYAILNNFKNKICHYLFDETEVNTIIGRGNYKLPDIPGRAMVKLNEVNIMQSYCAVDFENEIDYSNKILAITHKLKSLYTGKKVESIRMLPDVLTIDKLREFAEEEEFANKIPVGLDSENVRCSFMELGGGIKLVIGGPQSGKTNILKIVLTLKEDIETYIVDSNNSELYKYKDTANMYISEAEEVKVLLENIKAISEQRAEGFEEYKKENPGCVPKMYYGSLDDVIIMIDDFDHFAAMVNAINDMKGKDIISEAINTGVTFIASAATGTMKGFDDLTKLFKSQALNAVILGNPNDQNIIGGIYIRNAKTGIDLAYNYNKGKTAIIKVPKI